MRSNDGSNSPAIPAEVPCHACGAAPRADADAEGVFNGLPGLAEPGNRSHDWARTGFEAIRSGRAGEHSDPGLGSDN